jgi:hypothetical protein
LFFALGVEEVLENNGVVVAVVDVPPNDGKEGAPPVEVAPEASPNAEDGAGVDAKGAAVNTPPTGAGVVLPVFPNKVAVLGVPNRPEDGAVAGTPPPNVGVDDDVPNKLLPVAGAEAELPKRLPLGAGEDVEPNENVLP